MSAPAGAPKRPRIVRQFGAFVAVGALAAAANWLSGLGLSQLVRFELAVALAYLLGMSVAFVLNKRWVFTNSGRALRGELSYFLVFNLIGFCVVWAASIGLADYLFPTLGLHWHPRALAHAIAIALPLVFNFLLHKFVTFRPAPS